MKKIDSFILYLVFSIPVIFVIGFFIWGEFIGPNRQELFMIDSKNLSQSGVIDSIYNDKENHNSRTILLTGGNKMELYSYWEAYFEVGDSISKAKGSTKLFIYKKNKKKVVLDYKSLEKMFIK